MCWSESASVAMVGIGAVATGITWTRGEPRAIPVTLAWFTLMEALQVAGYLVLDSCDSPANKAVTMASYAHIALQPLFINAFGMALAGPAVTVRMRRIVYGLSALAAVLLFARLIPLGWAAPCQSGQVLCGSAWCTVSGTWHLGWEVPYFDTWTPILGAWLAQLFQFPAYMLAVFVLPLTYGAWRFALFHATFGPFLASLLTDNPNEIAAVWCLFSIGLVLIGMSPLVRRAVSPGGTVRPA
jgi:Family of unknown function (DUF5765)